jgi:hypothetical protein
MLRRMKNSFWLAGLSGTVMGALVAGLFVVATPSAAPAGPAPMPTSPRYEMMAQVAGTLASKDAQAGAADPALRASLARAVNGSALAATAGGIGLVVVIALVGAAVTDRRIRERRRAQREDRSEIDAGRYGEDANAAGKPSPRETSTANPMTQRGPMDIDRRHAARRAREPHDGKAAKPPPREA